MFELLFIVIVIATLMVTGFTVVTVMAAIAIAMLAMLVLGMIGIALKLLPWLLLILAGIWVYRNLLCQPKS
ncbi:envelope stress response protein PspG [Vibrio sp.]|uniref:envelope stress response protein PspG n=1 Tax=Vibrio sp. TaxID=678 RepID=UPI003D10A4E5